MELKPGMIVQINEKDGLWKVEEIKGEWRVYLMPLDGNRINAYVSHKNNLKPITKIKIRLSDNMELRKKQSEAIQRKAFSQGIYWSAYQEKIMFTSDAQILINYEENYLWVDDKKTDHIYVNVTPEQYLGCSIEETEAKTTTVFDKSHTSIGDFSEEIFLSSNQSVLAPECFRDKEQDRLVVMESIEYEVKPAIKYRCPLLCDGCQHTDTKENMIKHVKDVHGEHVSSNSPVWIHWQVS